MINFTGVGILQFSFELTDQFAVVGGGSGSG